RQDIQGCYMYQVVKKLESLKFPFNKLGQCKGSLFKIVNNLRSQLQKVQTNLDADPHDQPLRITKAMLVEKSYEAEHFETFLGTSHPVQVLDTDDNLFYRRISNEVVERMIGDVSHAEIKSALFDIDDFKAPDPDGFITAF
ncbi:hypothetical protein Tco_1008947, partial [Tanacetum coccineum]